MYVRVRFIQALFLGWLDSMVCNRLTTSQEYCDELWEVAVAQENHKHTGTTSELQPERPQTGSLTDG